MQNVVAACLRWTSLLQLTVLAPGDLQVSKLLQYSPVSRTTALGALTHPFFDELRDPSTTLPNGGGPYRMLLLGVWLAAAASLVAALL